MATEVTVYETINTGVGVYETGQTVVTISNLQGPQGPTGATGPVSTTPGPAGPPGPVTIVTGSLPISVATGTTTPAISIASATTAVAGAVQLSDSTSTTSSVLAATPTAVKSAYDLANGKVSSVSGTSPISVTTGTSPTVSIAAATTAVVGAVQLTDSVSSTSTTTAATANSARNAYNRGSLGVTNAATAQTAADSKVASVTGTAPIAVTSGTTPVISIDQTALVLDTSQINWSGITAWAPSTSYTKGALVEYQGIAYRRTATSSSGLTFNTINWQQITPTPASTSTASTLVLRDASGNFSAGTIIANLNGNATTATSATSSTTATTATTTTGNAGTVTNGVYTTDTGTVTSTMIANGTIVDTDINASAAIADTKLATISTAGKISNSATTATNANTASAIVARDASGNFSAGAITATDITDSTMTTVGVITNSSAGLLQSNTSLSTALGGTGNIYGSPLVGKASLSATYAKAVNDTTPEAVFRNAAGTIQYLNVDANSTYLVEGVLALRQQANAGSAAARLSLIYINTGNLTTLAEVTASFVFNTIFGVTTYASSSGVVAANVNADASFTSASALTHHIIFRGLIQTNASTAGRINIGATQSVAGTSLAPTFGAGSHLTVYKIPGSGLVQTFGNWS